MTSKVSTKPVAAMTALVVLIAASLFAMPSVGAETEYRKGPDPTQTSIAATVGPFATASTTVPASVPGFGGGRIYYPTVTSQGTFGAVAFAPGFTATSSSYTWVGTRVASQGFVVFLIDTDSRFDQPSSRADQLQAALDYLVTSSSVRTRVDATRLAVGGHSMGGGGALEAASERPSLQAAVSLQPWHLTKNWSSVGVPSMIIGAENDVIANVSTHSEPFYESIPPAAEKSYLELNNATHPVGTTSNTTQAAYTIVWLKRYVDNDTRYEQFICPNPAPSSTIQEYRGTCPG